MSDTNSGPSESAEAIRADVAQLLHHLCGKQGLHETLHKVVESASDERDIQDELERVKDIRPHLTAAEQEMDSDSADPRQVYEHLEDARSAVGTFRQECTILDYELPSHVYTGRYEILEEYIEYIESYVISAIGRADEWAAKEGE